MIVNTLVLIIIVTLSCACVFFSVSVVQLFLRLRHFSVSLTPDFEFAVDVVSMEEKLVCLF